MSKRKKNAGIKDSALKQIVRTPMFKMRVERDRTKYNRKGKQDKIDYNLKNILVSVFNIVISLKNVRFEYR